MIGSHLEMLTVDDGFHDTVIKKVYEFCSRYQIMFIQLPFHWLFRDLLLFLYKGVINLINIKFTCCFTVVDVDPLQLKVRVAMVGASGVNAMLVRDHLPELKKRSCSLTI